VMFATITSATPPATSPGNGKFIVRSLPGASCYLTRSGGGHSPRNSTPAVTVGSNGYAPEIDWGVTWTWWTTPTNLSFTATCTMPDPDNRHISSGAVAVIWP
jgi:hypothetical protein